MIPKIIHYCWFGGNPLPDEYRKYMETWRKNCPEYEIREWNEKNFDINQNIYCKEAYEAQKWAFVSDYARLKIIYEYGGIYLDTDVEVLKDLSPLICDDVGFIGFQNSEVVNTGLGFAAAPRNFCVKKMLDMYQYLHFVICESKFDLTPCPIINTVALQRCGLKTGKIASQEIQEIDGLRVYPVEFFNPLNRDTMQYNLTQNSYTVHWYAASWCKKTNIQKLKKFIPAWVLQKRTVNVSKKDIRAMEKRMGL